MRFEDLSPEDQKLVSTEFPEALEKEAAADVVIAKEMYDMGFNKLAEATAAELEKLAEEEEKDEKDKEKEEEMDEHGEKRAGDLSAFIERGYFDGLRKLGQERHGDENVYLLPFLAEKLAQSGQQEKAAAMTAKFREFIHKAKGQVGAGASAMKEKAKAHAAKAHEYGKKGGYHAAGGFAAGAAAGEAHGRSAK